MQLSATTDELTGLMNRRAIMESILRGLDALGRMGGDEFLVIAPESSAQQGEVLAERIRQDLENLAHENVEGRAVTVSIGIAEMSEESSLEELIGRADRALYEAKDEGRNRVRVFQAVAANWTYPDGAAEAITERAGRLS